MKHLLRIDSSIFSEKGVSTQLAEVLQTGLLRHHPDLEIIHKNLVKNPIPHLTAEVAQAWMTPEADKTEDQKEKTAYSDNLINELRSADAIILTAPMYNFSIPSMLKAWFDHIARAGVTFQYTATGAEGLLEDKPVYLITTRGGLHKGQAHDTEETLIRTFLALIGLKNIKTVYAEGLNMGDEQRTKAIKEAEAVISSWMTDL